jgi:hypothetical protein
MFVPVVTYIPQPPKYLVNSQAGPASKISKAKFTRYHFGIVCITNLWCQSAGRLRVFLCLFPWLNKIQVLYRYLTPIWPSRLDWEGIASTLVWLRILDWLVSGLNENLIDRNVLGLTEGINNGFGDILGVEHLGARRLAVLLDSLNIS